MLATLVVLLILAYIGFLGFFGFMQMARKRARKRFFTALRENLSNKDPEAADLAAISVIYGRMTEHFPTLPRTFRGGMPVLIEEFIYWHDTLDGRDFKRRFGFDKSPVLRERAMKLLVEVRRENPFARVSRRAAGLLSSIREVIEAGGKPELARSSLSQLAEEIEGLDRAIEVQRERQIISTVVSILGVILTFAFGLLSVWQLFRPVTLPGQ